MLSHLRTTVSSVANVVKGFLGFRSPTELGPGREADQWAPSLVRMYAEGIIRSLPVLRASLAEFAKSLSPIGIMTAAPAPVSTTSYFTTTSTSCTNYFYITVTGSGSEEQAEQLLYELAKRGVRF